MKKIGDLALVCGRFQTPHLGHEKLFDVANDAAERVIILVGSAQESGTERNPFDVQTRIEMLHEVTKNISDKFIIKPLNDLTHEEDITPEWGKWVISNTKQYMRKFADVMIYGNDESRSKWFDSNDIKDVTEIIINRSKLPISATMLRKLMVEDNFDEWSKWINKSLHKHYDRLRVELLQVPYYRQMYNELLRK